MTDGSKGTSGVGRSRLVVAVGVEDGNTLLALTGSGLWCTGGSGRSTDGDRKLLLLTTMCRV